MLLSIKFKIYCFIKKLKKKEKWSSLLFFWLRCQITVIYLQSLTQKLVLVVECYAWLISEFTNEPSALAQIWE